MERQISWPKPLLEDVNTSPCTGSELHKEDTYKTKPFLIQAEEDPIPEMPEGSRGQDSQVMTLKGKAPETYSQPSCT